MCMRREAPASAQTTRDVTNQLVLSDVDTNGSRVEHERLRLRIKLHVLWDVDSALNLPERPPNRARGPHRCDT